MNLKEKILKANDLTTEQVVVPEWDVTVHVTSMNAGQRDRFESSHQGSTVDLRARLLVWTVTDAQGELLFCEDDVTELTKKSAKAVDRVATVALKLNGLTPQDVDELEGN